jgi:high-affinity iron transporter
MLVVVMLFSQPVLASTQQLLQLVDYVGVDYSGAVENKQVINEVEYKEMQDFAAGIIQQLQALPAHSEKLGLIEQGKVLSDLINNKASAGKVRIVVGSMRQGLIKSYQVQVVPYEQPNLKQAAILYANQCMSCHGVTGMGDGPLSIGMEPPPINFTDRARYKQRTLYGLFNTISHGLDGTAMRAYRDLTEQQRWSLAFYVGRFAAQEQTKTLAFEQNNLANLATLTTTTPAQAEALYGQQGLAIMDLLRTEPELLFNKKSNLTFTATKLQEVIVAYRKNNHDLAYQLAVQAYLDGFELEEQNINTLDKKLKLEIESLMTSLRNKIRAGKPVEIIEQDITVISTKLAEADTLLNSKSISGVTAFSSAFFILLREGLEALLIVAALVAFLVKTKRQDGLRYIHFGWVSAIILGLFTWWASLSLIDISGASREITEGVAAIVATIVLLYVGFWMHDKTSVIKWKKFIDGNMQKALTSGTLWTLAGLSFIAVYREAFETILFYQALWIQTGESGQHMVLSGFLSAIAVLAIVAWLIMRYSVRLPLRQFFSVTGGLMFILAIIFAGKGIAALQEAGVLVTNPVNFFRVDLLGIYPNLQGLLVQLALMLIAVFLWTKKT